VRAEGSLIDQEMRHFKQYKYGMRSLSYVDPKEALMSQTKLAQGVPSGSSPLRSESSCDGQAGGRLDRVNGSQRHFREEMENISRKLRDLTKNGHSDSLKKIYLLFLRVR
jgi:hypothetical protein